MIELKNYQRRALDDLEQYLTRATHVGPQTSFIQQTNRPYHFAPGLENLPYVCLRVPTGGGKTFMACHTLAIASRSYLKSETPLCLWLVPTNAIREQTLRSLHNKNHPYRKTLDQAFQGRVSILDLTEALGVQRGILDSGLTVFVSTLAAFRVEDTEGRKIYEQAGALSHHFLGIDPQLLSQLEKNTDGIVPQSLANVIRLRRPIIIMDEAHNARTPLSFETLSRFKPSAIIEFTATPAIEHDPARGIVSSNVLTHVSAAELKLENMVKLPIKLFTHHEWKEVVAQAIQMQRHLEDKANLERDSTGEYLRPIVLFQAQPHRQGQETLDVEVLKKTLIEDFRIPEERIAVATAEVRGIEDVNLIDPGCPIRFIITVQALREGWDCSFAYVLCTISEQTGARAVEQIMGRILRLPGAKKKKEDHLNFAYAFAASPRFIQTAQSLRDALVENGFERLETNDLVRPIGPEDLLLDLLPVHPVSVVVTERPNLDSLPEALNQTISIDNQGQLSINRPLSTQEVEQLESCFKKTSNREAVRQLSQRVSRDTEENQRLVRQSLDVPLLAIRQDGILELFESTHLLDRPWDLGLCDASLTPDEFSTSFDHGTTGEVDVGQTGQIEIREIESIWRQLNLLEVQSGWTIPLLSSWLDQRIPHPDISQAQVQIFIRKALGFLVDGRKIAIEELARHKFRLREALEQKIDTHRIAQQAKSYQELLFEDREGRIEVNPELCLRLETNKYAPNWTYDGPYQFRKHTPPNRVGELKAEGEEFECAQYLDSLSEVSCWVRNLDRRVDTSFWLQTSTDRFYPDFVCKLQDGRILIVEHKGEDRYSTSDSIEKRALGELWAEKSGNKCLFIMTNGRNFEAIKNLIRSTADEQKPFELEIISGSNAKPYIDHLPVFSLKAAAGKFSGSQTVEELGWVKVDGHKLNREMFVAQVVGKSMEPRIPDGSYCIFRANPTGSRQGKIVLAQYRGAPDSETGGQFTIKRYQSTKRHNPDDTWEHEEIRLEPLNPSYEPIIVEAKNADDVIVIAEFIGQLNY